jgi:hypothetical protein
MPAPRKSAGACGGGRWMGACHNLKSAGACGDE